MVISYINWYVCACACRVARVNVCTHLNAKSSLCIPVFLRDDSVPMSHSCSKIVISLKTNDCVKTNFNYYSKNVN